uniref:Uncharacterized protein n=1 Tax=Anguilla anguilla TaxID=7936 RepID=A0A0E9XJZ5_ANGAN
MLISLVTFTSCTSPRTEKQCYTQDSNC